MKPGGGGDRHTFTYGDDCEVAPRAASLKGMGPGDYIFFIARLVGYAGDYGNYDDHDDHHEDHHEDHHGNYNKGEFTGPPGFYLTGFLEVAEVLSSVTWPPGDDLMARFGDNAHIRRAQADPDLWNRFWVFKGSEHSRRFRWAVPVTRDFWRWRRCCPR